MRETHRSPPVVSSSFPLLGRFFITRPNSSVLIWLDSGSLASATRGLSYFFLALTYSDKAVARPTVVFLFLSEVFLFLLYRAVRWLVILCSLLTCCLIRPSSFRSSVLSSSAAYPLKIVFALSLALLMLDSFDSPKVSYSLS